MSAYPSAQEYPSVVEADDQGWRVPQYKRRSDLRPSSAVGGYPGGSAWTKTEMAPPPPIAQSHGQYVGHYGHYPPPPHHSSAHGLVWNNRENR